MTHEHGRERHMTYKCEHCRRADVPLMYNAATGEYICSECRDIRDEEAEKIK